MTIAFLLASIACFLDQIHNLSKTSIITLSLLFILSTWFESSYEPCFLSLILIHSSYSQSWNSTCFPIFWFWCSYDHSVTSGTWIQKPNHTRRVWTGTVIDLWAQFRYDSVFGLTSTLGYLFIVQRRKIIDDPHWEWGNWHCAPIL